MSGEKRRFCICLRWSSRHGSYPKYVDGECCACGGMAVTFNTEGTLRKERHEARSRTTPQGIHILKHGMPLCGFSQELPCDWPDGHVWVSFEDPRYNPATCQECVERAKLLRQSA